MVTPYGFLLKQLVKRDLRSRYAGHALGFFWAFLQPLLQLILFTFIFTVVIPISLAGEREKNFALFLFSGLIPWMLVSEVLMRATTLLADQAPLIKKVAVPPLVFLLALTFASLIHTSMALSVFLLILTFLGRASLSWFSLPLLMGLTAYATLGPAMLLCSLYPFYRDIKEVLNYALMVWFYLSPIVYPLSLVPEGYRVWLNLNPLTWLLVLYRDVLLQGNPGPYLYWFQFFGLASLVNLFAYLSFKRWLREALDYL